MFRIKGDCSKYTPQHQVVYDNNGNIIYERFSSCPIPAFQLHYDTQSVKRQYSSNVNRAQRLGYNRSMR